MVITTQLKAAIIMNTTDITIYNLKTSHGHTANRSRPLQAVDAVSTLFGLNWHWKPEKLCNMKQEVTTIYPAFEPINEISSVDFWLRKTSESSRADFQNRNYWLEPFI